jgi:hypothetical protein
VRGFPVRAYRADVRLTPTGDPSNLRTSCGAGAASAGGTTITWSVAFEPTIRGTGPVLWVVLRLLILLFASSLARSAASLSPRHPDREAG